MNPGFSLFPEEASAAAPVQYSVYDSIVPVLSWIERALPPPTGLSLVTICRTKSA